MVVWPKAACKKLDHMRRATRTRPLWARAALIQAGIDGTRRLVNTEARALACRALQRAQQLDRYGGE